MKYNIINERLEGNTSIVTILGTNKIVSSNLNMKVETEEEQLPKTMDLSLYRKRSLQAGFTVLRVHPIPL